MQKSVDLEKSVKWERKTNLKKGRCKTHKMETTCSMTDTDWEKCQINHFCGTVMFFFVCVCHYGISQLRSFIHFKNSHLVFHRNKVTG